MPSEYLTTSEAAIYGLKSVTSGQIIQASAMIDAYLGRPEGLVYGVDSVGNPAYMVAPAPVATFTLSQAIAPGQSVAVQLQGPTGLLQVGDVLVLDQATPNLCESCVVQATVNPPSPSPSFAFVTVLNAHAQGATAQLGLTIDEERYMPASRPITRLSRTPTMNVISGVGRYGYGRRGDHADYNMEQFNLLAAVSKFGGPPVWELFQNTYPSGWDQQTGQIWVPAGIMLAYYSEVKLRYVAGFTASNIPAPIKMATAQIIQAALQSVGGGAVKSLKAGDTGVTFFSASLLSDDVKRMIGLYAARMYV